MTVMLPLVILTGFFLLAMLGGLVWLIARRRPAPGAWLHLLQIHGPLLVGFHLLVFTAILFGTRLATNALYDVRFETSNFGGLNTANRVYSEWPIDCWIGPAVVCVAFLALFVLLATVLSERLAEWRGDIVLIAGVLISAGIIAFLISRAPASHTDEFLSSSENHHVINEAGNIIQPLVMTPNIRMTRQLQSGGLVDAFSVVLLVVGGILLVNFPGVPYSEPRISRMAIWGAFSIVCCWPATTVFGIIAVWQIKRSNGRLYGLRLAAVEALLIPWILMIASISTALTFILIYIFSAYAAINRGNGPPAEVAWQVPFLISLLPALLIGFFLCRAAWRSVVGRPASVQAASGTYIISPATRRIGIISLTLAIAGAILPISITISASLITKSSLPRGNDVLLSLLVGIVLELVALGCGIVGRRTPAGKAGMIIALVALLLYVLGPAFFFARTDSHSMTHSTDSSTATPDSREIGHGGPS